MPPKSNKVQLMRTEVKHIEALVKKKLNSIDAALQREEAAVKTQCLEIKRDIDSIKAAAANGQLDESEWANRAVAITSRMNDIIKKDAEVQKKLLDETEELAKDVKSKIIPLKNTLPTILDFSAEDRVQLISHVDKSLNGVLNKYREYENIVEQSKKRIELLNNNQVNPTAPKEEIVCKLNDSLAVLMKTNDPETTLVSVLAQIRGSDEFKKSGQKNNKQPQEPMPKIK